MPPPRDRSKARKAKVPKAPWTNDFAALMYALQVPSSMGLLGTATEPYIALRQRFNIHGWSSLEEVTRQITPLALPRGRKGGSGR